VQPSIRASGEARPPPLHNSTFLRWSLFGFGSCAAAGAPSNSRTRMDAAPPTVPAPGAITLAPSADLQIELVKVLLLGSPRRGGSRLFHKFALALFDERRELHRAIIRNFDVGRRAPNAHRCHRRIDLHITGLRDTTGDESRRSVGQVEKGRIGFPV